ncbi:putative response regulator receiver domain protein [Megalodesulfovibrio gigas DSM 1382 = ATCC 19364]|uniref:histidine kinase n=1 Tax=Megalodesulfovibrio gigas (strain ATCC 19364 / DSM 1382 / NCIMB 9332 / VKM B-1759) TaxID=1121448 RepID=T2GBL6_MEGG1|nr:putative response regulator receiver domain protein [Megalodesulfovibrio gigas DSM 1382 = ATCC 19364]
MSSEKTILLVDDEEGIRKVLSLILRDAGYEVHLATSGEDALAQLEVVRPAIVLTDIKMPGMDGIELLTRIKANNPDIEVVMLTGHGDLDLAIQSIKREATDFVTKPINEDVLDIALTRAREHLAMRRQLRQYTEHLERLALEKSRELAAVERFAAVGQTAASLAHAIKNIASGLEGAIFLMESGRKGDDAMQEQGFAMLKDNVAAIRHLMQDLLQMGSERVPQRAPCDPDQPALEVASLLRHKALEAGVELTVEAGAGREPILMDAKAIHQCLMNLVGNAIEAAAIPFKGVRPVEACVREVRLTTSRQGRFICYRISDTGPGVMEEARERLFAAFATGKATGTGVGLMATKRIVEAHGGTIELENAGPDGATFALCLPAASAKGYFVTEAAPAGLAGTGRCASCSE